MRNRYLKIHIIQHSYLFKCRNLKSVIGSEVYYELQILMCYPFGLKVETITVSLFIQTTKGLVLLKEGKRNMVSG